MTTPPTLDGYITSDGISVLVWCEHCRRRHSHGHHGGSGDCTYGSAQWDRCVCPHGAGDGHRVAHCHSPDSPYDDTGYVIREVGYISDPDAEGRRLVLTPASKIKTRSAPAEEGTRR